jgi:hypothetical protein
MWSYEANADSSVEHFSSKELEADVPSKGSWQEDYADYCAKFSIIPCPNIKMASVMGEFEGVRVLNAVVDLSSWRAMLLACCALNSKVIEISVHGCRLQAQHIEDLAAAVRKMGTCQALKLQYLDLETTAPMQKALAELLGDSSTALEYASLRGNAFSDAFLAPIIPALGPNVKLTTLSLAENNLTDESGELLVAALRLNSTLTTVSLASNNMTGGFLASLATFLIGTELLPEDDAALKANAKVLGDKNKAIKDVNKKRKKAGTAELKELVAGPDCTVKREKSHLLLNRSLACLDLSKNPGFSAQLALSFAQAIATAPLDLDLSPAASRTEDAAPMLLQLGGNGLADAPGEMINRAPVPWLELSL